MKTKINTLLGAALSLLITFGSTHKATAQTVARIALTAAVTDRKTTTYQIFVTNQDGSGATQLTRFGGYFPSWSRNQKYIAFYRASTIYVI